MTTTPTCPKCGHANPEVQHRSDGVTCFRCEVCKHEWGEPQPAGSDKEIPPLSAIEPSGG
jgi:tRNA(Ile2) C34 agmatinyltransferase TiaS